MKITNDMGNLVYDTENPLCSIEVCRSQGQQFAFITALDIGLSHARLSNPHQKQYWGRHSWTDEEGSIREILATGTKWPDLNK